MKIVRMKKIGFDDDTIDDIYQLQFGCCSKPLLPCHVCNRYGRHFPLHVWKEMGLKYHHNFWNY